MEWRQIPGFPGYEASSTGLIKSTARIAERLHMGTPTRQPIRERILTQWMRRDKNGRPVCMMTGVSIKGKNIVVRVHRLILAAFVGPCPNGLVCCHNNGDPTNNRLENLRWDTEKSNSADAIAHGTYRKPPALRGERNNNAKLDAEKVRAIRAVPHYRGISNDLGKKFGVSKAVICAVRKRRTWNWV
jgi:hypothetical protein